MSLLLIDVDRFRAFNEAQGVQAGDQALKMIGQALSTCSKRQSDVLEGLAAKSLFWPAGHRSGRRYGCGSRVNGHRASEHQNG